MKPFFFILILLLSVQCATTSHGTVRSTPGPDPNRNPVELAKAHTVDGTINWGNQNNPSYGNCLDVLTRTALRLKEAEKQSSRVDVIFVAVNSSYQLWAPQYVLSDPAPEYTSKPVYNSVHRWNTVHESQIAEVKLSTSQFAKIQTPAQIKSVVNAVSNFMSWLTLFDNLEGRTFAVRAKSENRTAYALIKVNKQIGTDGSSGYLNVSIKSTN